MNPRAKSFAFSALILLSLNAALAHAGPPEVIPVRVPSSEVVKWFPAGTEWTALTSLQFESLVKAATTGSERLDPGSFPRLLRARHEARWDDGVLHGRTTLFIAPGISRTGALKLSPWTPAIDPGAKGSAKVRFDDSGQAEISVNASRKIKDESTEVVHWKLSCRPGSLGRHFLLGLPGLDACELVLDFPEGMEPEGPAGLLQGPVPHATKGRSLWRSIGKIGTVNLILNSRGDVDGLDIAPRYWVSGSTRIELTEGGADWVLNWSITDGPRGRQPLRLILDPGLELLGVSGLEVEGHQAEASPEGTRVAVRLRTRPQTGVLNLIPTGVTIRARAIVPREGAWTVPSARPLNGVWTGGQTTVRVDPSRTIAGVSPLAGLEIARRGTDPAEGRVLTFEASRPEPVAELTFQRPGSEVSADVQGVLSIASAAPRLTCRMTWRFDRGDPFDLAFELSPSWLANRVEIEGTEGPVPWHSETISGGGVRVHVDPPPADRANRTLVMKLFATSSVAGGRGPLALPRVRPVNTRINDEVWTAQGEEGVVLTPIQAKGLAWINPQTVPGSSSPALSWRWTTEDGQARVDRERPGTAPRAVVRMTATVAPERLQIEARIGILVRDEAMKRLPIALSEAGTDREGWIVVDETTGRKLELSPLPPDDRRRVGLEAPEAGWEVELPPSSSSGRVNLLLSYSGSPLKGGVLPLIVLPATLNADETVLVLARREVRTTARAADVVDLDPHIVFDSFAAERSSRGDIQPRPLPTTHRQAHAFRVQGPAGKIAIEAVTLESQGKGGVVREALLRTVVNPTGSSWQRLLLRVAPERATAIDLEMPPGSRLERVQRDGQEVKPVQDGDRLSIPLSAQGTTPRAIVSLSIDYLSAGGSKGDSSGIVAERPVLSLPCLGLTWEVVTPDHFRIARWSEALSPLESEPSDVSFLDRMRGLIHPGSSQFQGRPIALDPDAMKDLEAKASRGLPAELSLADWLTRWDAGEFPIIIDRCSLAESGWGPRSRVAPPRVETGSAIATLQAVGLTLIPLGKARLITTWKGREQDVRKSYEFTKVESTIREAIAWGADRSDRFQAVSRWREEPTPRSSADTLGESPLLKSKRTRRFVTSGWPGNRLEVRLLDERIQARWSWVAALAVMTLGLAAKRLSTPILTAGTVATIGFGLLAGPLVSSSFESVPGGIVAGALAFAFVSLGALIPLHRLPKRLRFPRRLRRSRGSSSKVRRITASQITAPGLLALAATSWAAGQTSTAPRDDVPILAIFPYDGVPDASRPPDRVLLRLDDHRRLSAMAEQIHEKSPARLLATSVVHRVAWSNSERNAVSVESEFQLVGEGTGPARWAFPVENARAIVATIDGQSVPVRVEPGGKTASVQVQITKQPEDSKNDRVLRLSRTVRVRLNGGEESISLAINPIATSIVKVERHPDRHPVEILSAGAPLPSNAEGLNGFLGPLDRLDLTWRPADDAAGRRATGVVEGLYLWDATGAGDRVRARLTYRNPSGTSMVRIKLGPGVMVRSWSIPGVVHAHLEGSAAGPEWVAQISPSLPDGSTLSIDAWRPRGVGSNERRSRPVPKLDPVGVERFSALMAFRRPPEWTGRMTPEEPADAVSEEAFARAWGPLPVEPLTLSGVVRDPSLEVDTGPVPARFRVSPSVRATLSPGRIDLNVVAEIVASGGASHDLTVVLPDGFNLGKVDADGLTDCDEANRVLKLRFDGPTLPRRQVRIVGWTPLVFDPLNTGATTRELEIPWPRWPDQIEMPGVLSVVAPTHFQIVDRDDGVAVPPESVDSAGVTPPYRATYRVAYPQGPGKLRWDVEPPQVSVRLRSQVAVEPGSVGWTALVQYDVSGGPLDTINLRLGTEWAKFATVRLVGVGQQQVKEVRDPFTYWSIRPERPVWGSLQVLVQASRPLEPGKSFPFPDLSPLGKGGVDTTLRVANQTGRTLKFEKIQGLQPVAPSSLPLDEELAFSTLKAATTTEYRVIKPGWTLDIEGPDEGGVDEDGQPRVLRGELNATIDTEGSALGIARFEVGARSGAFIAVTFDGEATLLYAAVNGSPVQILKDSPGRWLIPLAEAVSSRVSLVWNSSPPASKALASGGLFPLSLPVIGSGRFPTIVSLRAPSGTDIVSPQGRLLAASPERVNLERARRLSRQLTDSLKGFDRSSRKDGEDLVAAIVRCELWLRQAERASAWDPLSSISSPRANLSQTRLVAREIRERLSNSLRNVGLEHFETSARVQLGLASSGPGPESSTVSTLEPALAVQIRPVGFPHYFLGELQGGLGPWLSFRKTRATAGPELLAIAISALFIGLASASGYLLTGRKVIGTDSPGTSSR